ncbi:MAG: Hsp70 family protein [Deltaproteobacteria bacterium]|nr:Hsp70 family protein [Deltaproteobacteria bacterium]
MSGSEPILAIDFGTSKSCMAVTDAMGQPRVLLDPLGRALVPSIISFRGDGHLLVGTEALDELERNPLNSLRCEFRPRDLGPRETLAGAFSDADLCSVLLDHLRRVADATLQLDTRRVLMTVPALLPESQKQALAAACGMAGLILERIVEAPVAAAMSFALGKKTPRFAAVYDFGGGKFECSLLDLQGGSPRLLATAGDLFLGGDDVDQRLASSMLEAFFHVHGVDLRGDHVAWQRVMTASEAAKRALSTALEHVVKVDALAEKAGRLVNLKLTLTREVFHERIADVVERSIFFCDEALRQAGLSPPSVEEIWLVGGMTRVPAVAERVAAHFGREPRSDIDPELAVVMGAAVLAADAEAGQRVTAPYGVGSPPPPEGVASPVAGRVARVATKKMFTAMMQAQPEVKFSAPRPAVFEVTASPLSVSTVGGFCDEVIGRNQQIPFSKTRIFSTGKDGQKTVQVRVCQGDSRRFDENAFLGTLFLEDLPPRSRGQVRIAVTFHIDADGVLEASARDEETGRAHAMRIQLSGASAG